MTNRELCERYPFLIPSNRWSGMKVTDPQAQKGGFWPGNPEAVLEPYEYDYTELDDMPEGWRKAFGEQMCEEIREELLKAGGEKALEDYRIIQIKEKFGALRWYTNWTTDAIKKIIDKYTALSEHICIRCGKLATHISLGWISPYCDDCAAELSKTGYIDFAPIDDVEDTYMILPETEFT